jgi:hypothetical protein
MIVVAAAALVTATGAWALGAGGAGARATPNAQTKKSQWTMSNGGVDSMTAPCPPGTKVFSGSYAIAGANVMVTGAGMNRVQNGYMVVAYIPPVNLSAGVGKVDAVITVVAWCAPPRQPIVLP